MALVEITSVEKRFPGVKALDGVSLSIDKGDVHGLIGPNGSGKSTTIACVMGRYGIDGGAITYDGIELRKQRIWDRVKLGINATSQTAQYVPTLSVRRHIELPIEVNGYPKSEVERIAELTSLTDVLDEEPDTLSAVGARRLEIARALASGPSFIMLDECFAGLSFKEGQALAVIIKRVVSELGVTALVVDHNLSLVEDVAHMTTVIDRGQVIACGTFKELLSNEAVITAYMG
jgi:ABC-type branched-subunit amino acid transport system ATPase component